MSLPPHQLQAGLSKAIASSVIPACILSLRGLVKQWVTLYSSSIINQPPPLADTRWAVYQMGLGTRGIDLKPTASWGADFSEGFHLVSVSKTHDVLVSF